MSAKKSPPVDRKNEDELTRTFSLVEDLGSKVFMSAMVIAFLLYMFGVLKPTVPLEDLPHQIAGGADAFTRDSGVPAGWGFLSHLGQGDMLSLAAMMLVVVVVFLAYIVLIPGLLRRKDWLFLLLVLLQLAVFTVAGGGWLGGGG